MIRALFTVIELGADLFFSIRFDRFSSVLHVLLRNDDPGSVSNAVFFYKV